MALVRKTDEIAKEINKKIDEMERRKALNLFKSLEIQETMLEFFERAWHSGVFFPKHCIEPLTGLGSPEIQNLFHVDTATAQFSLVGQNEAGQVNVIWAKTFALPREFSLPPANIKSPLLAVYIPHQMGIYFAGRQGHTQNQFSVVMLLPHILSGGEIHSNPQVIPLDGCNFVGDSLDAITKNAQILAPDTLPEAVTKTWYALLDRKENFWEVIQKFEKTREYIFTNLWQFPSVNKMIEFFPNLKGLLSDKTVSRYMKGTTRKKAEYGVVAPSADIIGATVEANMSGILPDDK